MVLCFGFGMNYWVMLIVRVDVEVFCFMMLMRYGGLKMYVILLVVDKVKDMVKVQGFEEMGFCVMVVGGGCFGFMYDMDFENKVNSGDWELKFEDLNVVVDFMSYVYLEGMKIDYIELF